MRRIIPILFFAILAISCSDAKRNNDTNDALSALQSELDSLKNLSSVNQGDFKGQISTFLTFQNNDAEEAMNFYVSLFENSKIVEVERHGKDGFGKEGTIFVARFVLNGSQFACSDSPMKHEWDFSPGVSIWVECKSEEEIQNLFAKLSENGQVFMPMDNYGFSSKFAFIEDRFGVSWQINLQ